MVVLVWLWIVPLLTCWMWRLGFTTSFSHGLNTVTQRLSPLLMLADCIQVRQCSNLMRLEAGDVSPHPMAMLMLFCRSQGSVITATLIFFVVIVNYIGDVVKQLTANAQQQAEQPPAGACRSAAGRRYGGGC